MDSKATGLEVSNKIFLWCNPRSLSTVFEKCVSYMDGAEVWHKPYLMSFVNNIMSSPELLQRYSKMKNTKRREEEASVQDGGNLQPLSVFRYDWVQGQLEAPLKKDRKFLFVKDWPGAIDGHFDKLPKEPFKHTFIIRNPFRSAPSFRKASMKLFHYEGDFNEFDMIDGNPFTPIHLPNPNHLHSFWLYVKNTIDPNPVVIDVDDLQNFPEQILRKYCEAVGIPFKTTYLKWDAGLETLKRMNGPLSLISKQADRYVKAATSSGFSSITSRPPVFESLTPDEQKYCSALLPGYQEMYLSRLKPGLKTA